MSALRTMRVRRAFLGLVIVQAFHSAEEYIFRLYEVFAPARLLSGLISSNLETGFLIINVSIVLFGAWCYWWPVRLRWSSAVPLVWFWVALETINGIGHPVWAIIETTYTPGLATSLLLLPLALMLARAQLTEQRGSDPTSAPREGAHP